MNMSKSDLSFLPSEDLIREQAYLVARGVRPMALLGHCETDSLVMLRVATKLESLSVDCDVLSFVFDRGDGKADFGFVSDAWVLDLYKWIQIAPKKQFNRMLGLLLGYDVKAIGRYEQLLSGRCFKLPETN